MKWIYSLLCGIVVTFLLSSCKKFLDKGPLDQISSTNYWQTSDDAINGINGAYQPLQWPKLYNLRMWTTDIWAGNSLVGAGGGTDGIETIEISNFITNTSNAAALDVWRGPSPGILRCNLVLANVPNMNIDQALKSRILGEAHFLRGLYYFILVRLFGDVPLVTIPVDAESNLRPTRTDKAIVYDTIISDLQQASMLLPSKSNYSGSDIGRASQGSALGMLAKVYLTLGDFQNTVKYCEQVLPLGYTLNADYSDNFNTLTKNSNESLFEIQYSGAIKYDFWSNENQSSWASVYMGPRNQNFVSGGGYGWNQPTSEFVNSYETGDLRKDKTILYQGGPDFDGNSYKSSYSGTGYSVRKFLVPNTVATAYNNSAEDFPVLRYADVLLMYAEALNEIGRTNDAQASAMDANTGGPLNRVRMRAGLPNISGFSQADLRTAIYHERRMELAFEGQRWYDLIRINNGKYALDFLHSIGKTNATSKYLLLPIPQQERDANPNLTQNTGY